MYIERMNDYSTNIKDILDLIDKDSLFISSWDKEPLILNFSEQIIEKSINNTEHKNTYIMSKGMDKTKQLIENYFIQNNIRITKDNFTIVSNGTSAGFISFLQVYKHNCKNVLFIGPVYFTYCQLMKIFQQECFYMSLDLFKKIHIDIDLLKKELLFNNIQCIIIPIPFFGAGIDMDTKFLKELSIFCEANEIYILIDYIYGNMEWNTKNHMYNSELINLAISLKYCILYESISKRIFLNGIKSALIYGNPSMIASINIDSEICQGSISFVQESILNYIYTKPYNDITNSFIVNSLEYAQNNYNILKALLLDTEFLICNTESGYFTLIGIPKKFFSSKDDHNIAKEIKEKCGIVTIPHSRYYYFHTNYYCFRVNLTLKTDKIIESFRTMLDFCSN